VKEKNPLSSLFFAWMRLIPQVLKSNISACEERIEGMLTTVIPEDIFLTILAQF